MLRQPDAKSAPGIQFGDQAPTRRPLNPEGSRDTHSNAMTPIQRAAWDRLWQRLLQPVEQGDEGQAA
jgi:hypothetical protein